MQKGGLEKAKTFQLFKSQIEKLNNQMVELEQQTEEWKENSEVRANKYLVTIKSPIILY